jgi:hypothetical protein
MSGYKAYQFYVKMKLHFSNKDVDFSKKRSNVSYESFEKRQDSYEFKKIGKKNNYKSFILANFLEDSNRYIRDFKEAPYTRMKRALSSLTYIFENKIKEFETEEDLKKYFMVNNSKSLIMNDLLSNKIDIEIICILNNIYNIVSDWESDSIFSMVYEKEIIVVKKYSVFFEDNLKKYENIIKKSINNNDHKL